MMKRLIHPLKRLCSALVYRFLAIGLPSKRPQNKDDIESTIGIVCLGALGDFILFCSVAKELYRAGFCLVLVCRAGIGIEEFAALTGYFTEIVAMPYRLRSRLQNLRLLKKIAVDTVIVASVGRHVYSDLCSLALRANRRILPDTMLGCSLPFMKRIVDRRTDKLVPVMAIYEFDRYEQYLQGVGAYSGRIGYYTFKWAKSNLAKRKIAVFPGAGGGAAKRWPVERFAYTALNLCREYRLEILVCGTDKENPLIQKFCHSVPKDIRCFRGATELAKLLPQLSECSLAIANDSGGAYLAIACGVPTLIIGGLWEYGRFYPGKNLPANCKALIASLESIPCAPCGKSNPDCVTDQAAPCVLAVTQDEVLSCAKSYFA